jgi:carboxypeptidase PM20D1
MISDEINYSYAFARLSELLIYETVAGNTDEFRHFQTALKEIYPNIDCVCEFEQVGELGLMYRFKGKDSSRSIVLMSHYDVVPAVSDEQWERHPFSGEIVDGVVFGRGAVDTKCTLCAVMETVETLIENNITPECDVYMCFGGDEETTGGAAVSIADVLEKRGIKPFLILDEGGAVIELPDSIKSKKSLQSEKEERVALVGIAEKGYLDVEFIARGPGGHTSLPVKDNPLSTIAEAVRRLENPFKPVINEPFKVMRDAIADYAGWKLKIALKSRLIRTLLMPRISRLVPEIGALTQTTGAVTLINGGSASNVVPEVVRAVGNFRVINGCSVGKTMDIIKKKLHGLDIEINILESLEPSKISRIEGEGWEKLNSSIVSTWGKSEKSEGCAVIPYLMIARSDSRSYSNISDNIYRFSPMIMSKVERASIHGINEKISQESFKKMIEFYVDLITNL